MKLGERVTPQQADHLLRDQVVRDYGPAVFKALPMAADFTPRLVNRQELPRWRFGDDAEVLAGLERRRAAEVSLFQG